MRPERRRSGSRRVLGPEGAESVPAENGIPKEGHLKCGIVLDWMGASAFVEAINNIQQAAAEMDVELITWDCNLSAEACVQGIENFIAADVDMIYVQNWTGYDTIRDVCNKALEKGITIVAYDNFVDGQRLHADGRHGRDRIHAGRRRGAML